MSQPGNFSSSGSTKTQMVGGGAWGILSGSDAHHASSDATLFSSSLPQYGDIRTLYTACKHRGFVMISYYDIRAARTAMRMLQNKPLRRRKLDIHFSIPKDNPSEKDVNQGTLVVFNLDPSVSNEDLLQIFGAYGEVKEIKETPHKRHHKFIEYYDVRAAEAALKSLNRSDIAGKRIKLEPSRPGGARRNLMLQLNQDPEQDESRNYLHPVGSPVTNSPPGSWVQFNSPTEHSPMYNNTKSPGFRTMSPTNSNYLPGLASILHPQVSNTLKVAPIGSQGRGDISIHIFTNTSSTHGSAFQHSHSMPEPNLNRFHGTLHSSGPSTSSGSSAVETLSGPQFLWGSPTLEKTNSSVWPQKAMGHQLASNGKGHTHPFSGPHSSFLSSSPHHHHVGSAPSGIPFDRHFSYVPESSETSFLSPAAYGGMGLGPSGGNLRINRGTHTSTNVGFSIPGSVPESSSSSFNMMSSPKLSPMFLGNGPYMGLPPTSIDGLTERGRSRRVENNGNQIDSKKQFQLDLDKIISGEDTRTTLMIKNIPNKYTSKMLLAAIDENHKGTYDFLYLPIDFKNKCNVGYAFINMLSPSHIIPFYQAFNGKKWEKFNSEKVASLAYGRIQGKEAVMVFNRIPHPGVYIYTKMIRDYAQRGRLDDALKLFYEMPERDVVSCNAMIKGCLDCGDLRKAKELFDGIPEKSVVSWTTMMNGFLQFGELETAECLFQAMPARDVAAWNSMIHGYFGYGRVEDAKNLFEVMPGKNAISWTSMIAGLDQNGRSDEALVVFREMVASGVQVTLTTFVCVMTACANLGRLDLGVQVHGQIVKVRYCFDEFLAASLITLYANCKQIENSHKVFKESLHRNVVVWTALITGCGLNSKHEYALKVFRDMVVSGVLPNQSSFTSALNSCLRLEDLHRGKEIHATTVKLGFETDPFVGNSLIVLYAKCGTIRDGAAVFKRIGAKNIVSWNSTIIGCAQHGRGKWALALFNQMIRAGVGPDEITFTGLLSACSHSGMLQKARGFFRVLSQTKCIEMKIEHYTCMVDVLGRFGELEEAEEIIKNMPVQETKMAWLTLLGACRMHSDLDMAERAAKSIFNMEPNCSAACVLLSNIYASANRWRDVSMIREKMQYGGTVKQPGSSWFTM